MDIKKISEVLGIIKKNKYQAYLVGGSSRDFLYQRDFLDIDIATNAPLNFLKSTFEVDDLSGQAFGSIKIKYKGLIMEITRFRKEHYDNSSTFPKIDEYLNSPIEDAKRRDFSINALYLDLTNNEIIDPYNGLNDLFSFIVRFIGDPKTRIIEDPTRILRGIRLVNLMNFKMDIATKESIIANKDELARISESKTKKEIAKLVTSFGKEKTIKILKEYNIEFGDEYYD